MWKHYQHSLLRILAPELLKSLNEKQLRCAVVSQHLAALTCFVFCAQYRLTIMIGRSVSMSRIIRRVFSIVAIAWTGSVSAAPITDTVTVEGLEWAQPDLFVGLLWSDINAVCPGGVCGSQTLNGNDMHGWSWATVGDLTRLFNHYIGYDALGPEPERWVGSGDDFSVSAAFFADGWRTTLDQRRIGPLTMGLVSDSDAVTPIIGMLDTFGFFGDILVDTADTGWETRVYFVGYRPGTEPGAWFYRTPGGAVPIPSTLILVGLGLIGLKLRRLQSL